MGLQKKMLHLPFLVLVVLLSGLLIQYSHGSPPNLDQERSTSAGLEISTTDHQVATTSTTPSAGFDIIKARKLGHLGSSGNGAVMISVMDYGARGDGSSDDTKPCTDAPTAVTFTSCTNLQVDNLKFKDSQKMHVSFERCSNVQVSNLDISAPGTSPNTDGIHVSGTTNIHIDHCVIQTGDDCISIVSGSQYVNATNINCGPGHGISIGSLGAKGALDTVSNVLVDTAQLQGTTNGVRIKTWQGGKGYAKNIIFKNVFMKNVKNPIIIDQNYCDSTKACSVQKSAVAISGVTYKNITGTSATSVAMEFDCSEYVPCRGIVLQDINLASAGGGSAKSICNNAQVSKLGTVVPSACN